MGSCNLVATDYGRYEAVLYAETAKCMNSARSVRSLSDVKFYCCRNPWQIWIVFYVEAVDITHTYMYLNILHYCWEYC